MIRANYRSSTDYPGDVGQRFPYTIKENTNDAYLVEAYLIKGKSPKGDHTFMFISSRKYHFPVSDVRKLYKLRFRIENSYRHARVCKIRTASQNYRLVTYLWAFSQFIELVWELNRVVQGLNGVESYELRQKRLIRRYRRVIEIWILGQILQSKDG